MLALGLASQIAWAEWMVEGDDVASAQERSSAILDKAAASAALDFITGGAIGPASRPLPEVDNIAFMVRVPITTDLQRRRERCAEFVFHTFAGEEYYEDDRRSSGPDRQVG